MAQWKAGIYPGTYKKELLFEKIKDAVDVFRLVLTDIYELNTEQMKTEFDID